MASMKWLLGLVGAVLTGAVTTVGCSGRAAAPATTAASAPEDDASSSLLERHRYHHPGAVTLFIAMSLDTLAVSPDQTVAVGKLQTELDARMEPARLADQGLLAALADGVAAGGFDTTRVDAAVAQVAAAVALVQDASASTLDALHEVLTPLQRATLMDKVESHWAVWQAANADDPAQPSASHLAALATDLELTPEQVDKIRAGLEGGVHDPAPLDRKAIAAHLVNLDEAFRSDKFEAKSLPPASEANAHAAGWGAAHMAHFVETVSPLLTPEQRGLLAQSLREHATHEPAARGERADP
jgi:Spy/CpxP family protein refolding chaperone